MVLSVAFCDHDWALIQVVDYRGVRMKQTLLVHFLERNVTGVVNAGHGQLFLFGSRVSISRRFQIRHQILLRNFLVGH